MVTALLYLLRRVKPSLCLSPVLLAVLILLHGPAYLFYTRVWGPGQPFFERILSSAADPAEVIANLDLAIGCTLMGVCLGIEAADLAFACDSRRMERALRAWGCDAIRMTSRTMANAVLLGMAGVVVLSLWSLSSARLDRVWEFVGGDGGEFDKIELRRATADTKSYVELLLTSTVFPFACFALVPLFRAGLRRALIVLVPLVATILVSKAATLSKAPIVVFVALLGVSAIACRTLRPSARLIAAFTTVTVGMLMLTATVAIVTLGGPREAIQFLGYRIFMVTNEVLLEYFTAIPQTIPHTWGTNSGWVAGLLGQTPDLPLYWRVGEVHRGALTSTSNAMFLGDAWGEFGWLGVLSVPPLAGFIVRWIDIKLVVQRGKSVGAVAGMVLGLHGVFIAMSTSLTTALLSGGLAMAVPLALWIDAPHAARARPRCERQREVSE